ncbi:MAG: hypothetical protein BGO27_03865 [Alphaproteobacteria bacterium 33-17]|nr:MAG: hypothetical protein BGO27_03865 [Alphaproteobacteria bacterium 33-17]
MKILIIGQPQGELHIAGQIAKKNGASVRYVSNIDKAIEDILLGNSADAIFADIHFDIADLKDKLEQEKIFSTIIACGIDNNKDRAVLAIKQGAAEYLPLPPDEELISAILEAVTKTNSNAFIADSPIMQRVSKIAKQIAPSDATVLITGESGTGKEVMARFIHQNSKRSTKPFVAVNCAAIPENLLESELFGHEKGAFTGSVARRIGKFEEANGGTLLLDEISEIDIRLQAKLLRAIQEKQITRVGSNDNISLDVRILATSNRELKNEVKAGRFREDLFFRLNVINLQLPKLSERKEDIMDIAKHYAEKYAKSNGIKTPSFSKEAADIIINYEWPGNVRELENTIYRAILLAIDGVVYPESLMLELNQIDKPKTLAEMEKEAIQGTMQKYFGDKNLAANILGISIKILEQKLNEYDLAFEK